MTLTKKNRFSQTIIDKKDFHKKEKILADNHK